MDCGPHKPGRVDCVAGLEITEFLGRNRSLLIYNALYLEQPVLAYEYAPLGLVARDGDGTLLPANDAADAPMVAARLAWRQAMMAIDSSTLPTNQGIFFVQPRSESRGAAWWIGAYGARRWPIDPIQSRFGDQARMATDLARALHQLHGNLAFHGNINPWACVTFDGVQPQFTACLPDERGFLRLLGSNASLWQPGYSPPELADGARRLPLGPWSDVYGLSALMFQAITGAPPPDWTQASDPQQWRSNLSAQLDGLCLPKVQKVIIAGLSLDFAERPQTAQAWHSQMDIGPMEPEQSDVLGDDDRAAAPPIDTIDAPTPDLAEPSPKSRPGIGFRFVIAALLLLGAAGWAASALFAPVPATSDRPALATAPPPAEAPEPMAMDDAPDTVMAQMPSDDPQDDQMAVDEAVRDVPTARLVPAPEQGPPPVVVLTPTPRPQPTRTAPPPAVRPRAVATAAPATRSAPSYESEAETTRRLNAQQAAAARRQNEQNRANAEAERRAKAERERKIAADQEAYRLRLAATEEERLRRQRAYQAAQDRWKADVAACQSGDRSRCAR